MKKQPVIPLPTSTSRLPQETHRSAQEGTRPSLTSTQRYILDECRKHLAREAALQHEHSAGTERELTTLVYAVAEKLGYELNSVERDDILAQLEYEQQPFGILQPLVDDPHISDIIVADFSSISVQQGRRNFHTDMTFPDQSTYEAFVQRLLQRAGTAYSTKQPIADGMIGSLARIHAIHSSLCDCGPYLTIRLNRFSSVSTGDLMEAGLAPSAVFDYLRAVIHAGNTVLVVGEVGTGKTTLVRALAATIPSDEAILVIEDTPEIRLEHPHVRYLSTREENTDGAGRITSSQCIRAGMRMAMNRIIFGEMRDAEAAESFVDVCASGHPGLSTLHAKSAADAISRLELFLGRAQKGVSKAVLSEQITTAVQVIVFINVCPATGSRRVIEVREIGPVADGIIRHRTLFSYQHQHDVPTWQVRNRVSAYRESIEASPQPVILHKLPAVLELPMQHQYRDAAYAHHT